MIILKIHIFFMFWLHETVDIFKEQEPWTAQKPNEYWRTIGSLLINEVLINQMICIRKQTKRAAPCLAYRIRRERETNQLRLGTFGVVAEGFVWTSCRDTRKEVLNQEREVVFFSAPRINALWRNQRADVRSFDEWLLRRDWTIFKAIEKLPGANRVRSKKSSG